MPDVIIVVKLIKTYLSLMNLVYFKTLLSVNLLFLGSQISAEALSAHEYAERTHDNIIEIIQTKNQLFLDNPELFTKEISDAFSPIVDFKRIAKNVMGKFGKRATAEQMSAFSEAFENSLLDTYASTLVEFKDEKIIVLPPTGPSKSKTKARVNIEIVTSSNVYPGRYSMYLDNDGNWKIINIEINGMNLGKIFRNQFYSLMEKNQEDIDLVIEKWVASV